MTLRIEDYAVIGDTHTVALVGNDGSIDWLCLPRFDSTACFASLLGTDQNGSWSMAPTGEWRPKGRRYRPSTLVLETEFETADGVARVVDCMPTRDDSSPRIVRVVEGLEGSVEMHTSFMPRFDYGRTKPWIGGDDRVLRAGAGPEALELGSDVPLQTFPHHHAADFTVEAGQRLGFVLAWYASWEPAPEPIDAFGSIDETVAWWQAWTGDASLTLEAMMAAGYVDEATTWRDWVIRAVAGDPEDLQIMYGIGGERRLDEYELPWLPGYEGSSPVRVGNAASGQLQLDVYGELVDTIYRARQLGMQPVPQAMDMASRIIPWLQEHWRDPDDGIWEVRGPRRHFVHSKVMAWVAADRMAKMAEATGIEAKPLAQMRDDIHEEVCREGFDADRNTFTQYYRSEQLDAALLLIPQVGFLPPSDPRVAGTVDAIQRELVRDGFVMRYIPDEDAADGLPPGEGAFLACSFWLVTDLAMLGRVDEAGELFERLLALQNDVGLFSEEYDPTRKRLIGKFPQAFTHLTLIAAAVALGEAGVSDGKSA